MTTIVVDYKSESSILEEFRKLQIHKCRGKIETLTVEMKPIIQGILNYYGKFSSGHMRRIWNQLNKRLMQWVKWAKGVYVMASVR